MLNPISNKMALRLAPSSIHAMKACSRPFRALRSTNRHQSTTSSPTTATPQQPTTPMRTQQTQPPSQPQAAMHPSSVSHPALGESAAKAGNDNTIFLVFGGLLLGGIPLSYWYWGYRERAMRAKKEEMLKGIQERYAARHANHVAWRDIRETAVPEFCEKSGDSAPGPAADWGQRQRDIIMAAERFDRRQGTRGEDANGHMAQWTRFLPGTWKTIDIYCLHIPGKVPIIFELYQGLHRSLDLLLCLTRVNTGS
ncbi:hypothetical protein Q7P37_010192 [Cladosporium fusiforme]